MTFRPLKSNRAPCRSPATATILVFGAALLCLPAHALAQTEGNYLYNVTMVRAAPGHFMDMLATIQESFELNREAGDPAPFLIRHSQGDQWDFMLIYPMDDFSIYYQSDRAARRAEVWASYRGRTLQTRLAEGTSWKEEWFARSVSLDEMTRRFEPAGFFHVEMFAGLPGKRAELLDQRRMENRYYESLARQQNLLFIREAGSNWDAMTIGFYETLQTYAAAGARYTQQEQDQAARAAGFESVGDIGPYLRSLLGYHHDTLGVRVR